VSTLFLLFIIMPECIICLDDAEPEDLEIHSSNRIIRLCMSSCECDGFIHVRCLKDWINRDTTHKTKCPICRTRGENFTLLECEPSATPTPTPAPREQTTNRQHTTREHLSIRIPTPARITTPTPSAPPIDNQGSHIVVIEHSSNTQTNYHNMDQTTSLQQLQQADRDDRTRRQVIATFMILSIVGLVIVWGSFMSNS
jgi:hypothetical protein